jgi:RND family efflux transporter MFP subunit
MRLPDRTTAATHKDRAHYHPHGTDSGAHGRPGFVWLPLLFWVVCIAGCAGKTSPAEEAAEASGEESVAVRAEAAQIRSIAQWIQGLGRCEALLDRSAAFTPAADGKVHQILVAQGDRVTAGAPIVQLDSTLAEATLAEKKAECDALQASLRLLRALPRREEQTSYQLAIDTANAAVEKAAALVERLQPLRERGEVSQMQMFEAETALKQARLQQQSAEVQLKIAMLGPRPQAVEEAEAKIATAEAAMTVAKTQLELLTIRSPIAGVVDSITCRPGQTVAAGASIGEVVDARQVCAEIWLPPADRRLARVGQKATVTCSELKRTAAESGNAGDDAMAGRVIFVGSVVDAQSGNLLVRLLVDNAQGRLAIGQTVAAAIAVNEKTDVLAVPLKAVEDLGDGPILNVIRADKSVVLHPSLGVKDKQWVEITGTDLQAGEPVITEGGYNLPDDTPVTARPMTTNEKQAATEPPDDSGDNQAALVEPPRGRTPSSESSAEPSP